MGQPEVNLPALAGYLWALHNGGDDRCFNDFLDGDGASGFTPELKLSITAAGPISERAWTRVEELAAGQSVASAANAILGWHNAVETDRLVRLVAHWVDRIEDQLDYNAAIRFVGAAVADRNPWIERLDDLVVRLVGLRQKFAQTGTESWDWSELARRQLEDRPADLVRQMLPIIVEGGVYIFGLGEEHDVLEQAVTLAGIEGWDLIMTALAGGAWWIQNDLRSWLAKTQSLDSVKDWIGKDVERARLAASVAHVDTSRDHSLGGYLLDEFGFDEHVSSLVKPGSV